MINKLFTYSTSFGKKDGPLFPIYEELDAYRGYCMSKKVEIEELIDLMTQRVIAEQEYSQKLIRIRTGCESVKIGILGEEVEAFKADCHSKGLAAKELGDNIAQDCVFPLQKMIEEQEIDFKSIIDDSRKILDLMSQDNTQVNDFAFQYFNACDTAEKSLHNYHEIKLMTAMPYEKRQDMFDKVLNSIDSCKHK
jgi:hypothetical protein